MSKTFRGPASSPTTVLERGRGFWSVIVPEERVNLMPNPQFGYAANYAIAFANGGGASMSRSSTPYIGTAAMQIVFTGTGNRYVIGSMTRTLGQPLTLTAYVKSVGVPARIALGIASSSVAYQYYSGPAVRVGSTDWVRLSVTLDGATLDANVSTTPRLMLLNDADNGSTRTIVVGFVQAEESYSWTTPISGDLPGCKWLGAPHFSQSRRTAQTNTGGRIVNLKEFGYTALSLIGAGAAALNTIGTDFAYGGGYYQRSTPTVQNFTIAGEFNARAGFIELGRNKKALWDAVKPKNEGPVRLIYQPLGCNDSELGRQVQIDAVYTGGLEGSQTNEYIEPAAVSFRVYAPYVARAAAQDYLSLDMADTLTVDRRIIQRDRNGVYTALAAFPTAGAVPRFLLVGPDQTLYAVANNSTVTNDAVYRYDAGTWTSIGLTVGSYSNATLLGRVYRLLFAPNGALIALGDFRSMSGVANTQSVALWDGTNWSSLGTGLTATASGRAIYDALYALNGDLVVVGDFSAWNGVAAQGAARLGVGGTTAMNAGLAVDNILAYGLAMSPSGDIFTAFNTSFVTNWTFKRWANGAATWNDIGTAIGSFVADVNDLAILPDGSLMAAGWFDSVEGVTSPGAVLYNGSNWQGMGGGLRFANGGPGQGEFIFLDELGRPHLAGEYNYAGGVEAANLAIWTGSSWVPPDVDMDPTVATPYGRSPIRAMAAGNSNRYIGFFYSGITTAEFAGVSTLTNDGNTDAAPMFIFVGPGEPRVLHNLTTERSIYFNLILQAGESAVLTLGQFPTFVSNYRGDVSSSILRGSNLNLNLIRGTNKIALLMRNTTGASSAGVVWNETFDSIDAAVAMTD